MYLLMLLATFMSAIYGYNLSVRPDLDRDIPHKKAMAVIYKFLYQHNTVRTFLISRPPSVDWQQPDDLFYGEDDFYLNYKSSLGGDPIKYPLREKGRDGEPLQGDDARDYMQTGRLLYDGDVMATRLFCPEKELYEQNNKTCKSTDNPAGGGGVVDSCCEKRKKYLISYSKLDARWRNRFTGKISSDFYWAISKQEFKTNIGVVTWKDNRWNFQGRTKLEASYHDDKEKYYEEQLAAGVPYGQIEYPSVLKLRTSWILPEVFDGDFFKDSSDRDMCKELGCLFRIDEI